MLAKRVQDLKRKNGPIILAGHFCIFGVNNGVEVLPESAYSALDITRTILLESDIQTIMANLCRRDGKDYSEKSVSTLIERERKQSEWISKRLKCPLDIYKMTFTDKDLDYVASLLY